MKNKVKIGQLVSFIKSVNDWGQMNPNNKTSPLGVCINKVMFDVDGHVKVWRDAVNEYNKKVSTIKAKHASEVTISENSQSPEHAVSAYKYEGTNLLARNQEIDAEYAKFQTEIKAIEEIEVEIEVDYVKNVPTEQVLPTQFITPMRGIVIDPEYDFNKKFALAKA